MTKKARKDLAEFLAGFILHELGGEDADLKEAKDIAKKILNIFKCITWESKYADK